MIGARAVATGGEGKTMEGACRGIALLFRPVLGLIDEGKEIGPEDTIARTLASRKVSPKGPASGMRMLTFFINRAGRDLSRTRRAELQRAKRLLSERVRRERERRERKSAD